MIMLAEDRCLKGVRLLSTPRYEDDRGYFMEIYNEERVPQDVFARRFVQDNLSCSHRGVFRGMHAQKAPHAQGKWIRVLAGCIVDYVLDVTVESPTYGQWVSFVLDSKVGNSLYIPAGYAHGFVSLADDTLVYYKVDAPYCPDSEVCYHYTTSGIADDALSHLPPGVELILSEKDRKGIILRTYRV